tara:strand:- start:345 stop:470 length:126 start_codon:yes stop_codon:yes gene_type:complete
MRREEYNEEGELLYEIRKWKEIEEDFYRWSSRKREEDRHDA